MTPRRRQSSTKKRTRKRPEESKNKDAVRSGASNNIMSRKPRGVFVVFVGWRRRQRGIASVDRNKNVWGEFETCEDGRRETREKKRNAGIRRRGRSGCDERGERPRAAFVPPPQTHREKGWARTLAHTTPQRGEKRCWGR